MSFSPSPYYALLIATTGHFIESKHVPLHIDLIADLELRLQFLHLRLDGLQEPEMVEGFTRKNYNGVARLGADVVRVWATGCTRPSSLIDTKALECEIQTLTTFEV